VAGQVREEGTLALLKGFVRQFLRIAGGNGKASRRQVGACGPCGVQCIPRGYAGIHLLACLSTSTSPWVRSVCVGWLLEAICRLTRIFYTVSWIWTSENNPSTHLGE
jgi:hypothetical protein